MKTYFIKSNSDLFDLSLIQLANYLRLTNRDVVTNITGTSIRTFYDTHKLDLMKNGIRAYTNRFSYAQTYDDMMENKVHDEIILPDILAPEEAHTIESTTFFIMNNKSDIIHQSSFNGRYNDFKVMEQMLTKIQEHYYFYMSMYKRLIESTEYIRFTISDGTPTGKDITLKHITYRVSENTYAPVAVSKVIEVDDDLRWLRINCIIGDHIVEKEPALNPIEFYKELVDFEDSVFYSIPKCKL